MRGQREINKLKGVGKGTISYKLRGRFSNVECSYFDESLSGTYIESGIGPLTLEPVGVGMLSRRVS